jgi:hypothetical protein
MAFKSVKDYNEERYGGLFILRNDLDYADVIFLYQSDQDVLVADTHYIKSDAYSGYVHCTQQGCPACAKGIRTQTKLFIPIYNIKDDEIQFFDRSMKFEPQLQQSVFANYPNPSEYVFRITRHGDAGDMNTRYAIQAIGKNSVASYNEILAKFNATMPEYYNTICRDVDNATLSHWVNSSNSGSNSINGEMPNYTVKPRVESAAPVTAPPAVTPPTSSLDIVEDAEELDEDDAVDFS